MDQLRCDYSVIKFIKGENENKCRNERKRKPKKLLALVRHAYEKLFQTKGRTNQQNKIVYCSFKCVTKTHLWPKQYKNIPR